MVPILQVLGLCFLCLGAAASQEENVNVGAVEEGTALIDGRFRIASIDDDFICATLDWWPPEKCDYGVCSWGRASLLNLVCYSFFLITGDS